MERSRSRRASLLFLAALAGAVVATVAVRAVAVTTTVAGDRITRVKVLRSDTGATRTGGTTFVNVPGAKSTIFVPKGTRALVLVRFSAESRCSGGSGWCSVRVMVGANEAAPAAGTSFAFDAASEAGEYEAHAMERIAGPLDPGTYSVRVQWAVSNGDLTFWLDDWLMAIERVRFS
ncbi:MAG: hypothetical protein HY658_14270 [Actinobacteria bacterium]|nr:hypothetical protein [Actinomycetota bacterium]